MKFFKRNNPPVRFRIRNLDRSDAGSVHKLWPKDTLTVKDLSGKAEYLRIYQDGGNGVWILEIRQPIMDMDPDSLRAWLKSKETV